MEKSVEMLLWTHNEGHRSVDSVYRIMRLIEEEISGSAKSPAYPLQLTFIVTPEAAADIVLMAKSVLDFDVVTVVHPYDPSSYRALTMGIPDLPHVEGQLKRSHSDLRPQEY